MSSSPLPESDDAPGSQDTGVEEDDPRSHGRRSSVELIRDVVLSLIRVVEDSTELLTVSLSEELTRFREETERRFLAHLLVLLGTALVDTALAIILAQRLESWPTALLVLGGLHLVAGFLVYARAPKGRR